MKSWVPKNNLVAFAIASAIVCFLLYVLGLSLVLFEIRKIENAYNDTESSSSKNKRAQVIKSIAETNEIYIQTLRNFFVRKGDEVRFIEKIEEIGRQSKIAFEISSIDVKPGQNDAFKEEVLVKMKVEGSWAEIMNFLDTLDKIHFGVSVQDINLDLKSPNKWAGSIDFVVSREK